jgi:signal transduction histidine kinase
MEIPNTPTMENHLILPEEKLTALIKNAPMGLAEIDRQGTIIHLSLRSEELLGPIRLAHDIKGNNLFPVLSQIAPGIVEKIKEAPDKAGVIVANEQYSFFHSSLGKTMERHFQFMVTQIFPDCIIVSFDDITEKWLKDQEILQILLDKAVTQEKFEIVSNVLHDIGNAVVGFGSYLTRIKRSLEENNPENLQNLAGFFETQQSAIATGIGEAKAGAVLSMLKSIIETQVANQDTIHKSIIEQHTSINHIQEILNIQRQYMSGNGIQEKKATKLRDIINDCMSMLFASIEKRSIRLSINIPVELPLIQCNRTRLMQVILNILKNSIEAIDIHSIKKAIGLNVFSHDDLLILQVHDSGNGFDEATGRKLFERGFTTKSSGTGLGLNSCRAIIESFEGTIDITSDGPGKGALTTITFKI